jgi:hypothetical protein
MDSTNPQARKALIADFTGVSGILRTIPLAQTDATPDVFRSPDGSKDVVLVRDTVTGFLQAWIGPKGSDFPAMTAATWLTAQHSSPAFSADGLWLNYFTRDPVSGYVQLFRVAATP